MRIYKIAQDYKGQHSAPEAIENASLDNLVPIYPEDIYSEDAIRLYGDHLYYDMESMSIIWAARNRPNMRVKIYRAVPDVNKDLNKEIKSLNDILSYYNRFKFYPIGCEISDQLYEKHRNADNDDSYEDWMLKVYDDIVDEIERLRGHLQPQIKINPGDWVTFSPTYAKAHGASNLNDYRVVTKTVRAKDLYTDGNSIHEWGYNPS